MNSLCNLPDVQVIGDMKETEIGGLSVKIRVRVTSETVVGDVEVQDRSLLVWKVGLQVNISPQSFKSRK
jgi:hypothetical protein